MIIIKQAERLHKNAAACFVRLQADEYDNAIEITCLSITIMELKIAQITEL